MVRHYKFPDSMRAGFFSGISLSTIFFIALVAFFSFDAWGAVGIDHQLWNRILQKHVKNGLVDYRRIKNDSNELDRYLKQIADFPGKDLSRLSDNEQIAFYVNAYNAITVKRIINHYPPERGFFDFANPKISIKNISGVWGKIKNKVAGELLTLDDIEHKILRKKFKEPRIHVALVCASKGCPPLMEKAFTGDGLNEQLNEAGRNFLTDKTRNRFCADCPKISLSRIFSWYGGDFEKTYPSSRKLQKKHGKKIASVITFAASYLPPKTRNFLLNGDYKVDFLDYDWILNDMK